MVAFYGRDAWGARNPTSVTPMGPVQYVAVHHSVTPKVGTNKAAAAVKGIQTYQMGNNYSDIAYHFIIDGDGAIWCGRPSNVQGGATLGWNNRSIAICFLGDYRTDVLDPEQVVAFQWLVTLLLMGGTVRPERWIEPHSWYVNTECPGDNIRDVMWALRLPYQAPEIPPTDLRIEPMYNPPLTLRPIIASINAKGGGALLLADDGSLYTMGSANYPGNFNGDKAPRTKAAIDAIPGQKIVTLAPPPEGSTYEVLGVSNLGNTYGLPER